ncbi:hypothetical protein ACFTWF_40130 [Rhodococcus sp. NPDC056960]|uniref:hypothetical protein n=1 Tax=Rhodococcus sp. NPDC056960 TaxID=3345982 RepID=UPI0036446DE7
MHYETASQFHSSKAHSRGRHLIVEVGQTATGTRGRAAVLYDVNPHHGHTLGIVLERGHVAIKALDHKGQAVCERQIDADDENLPAAIADARALIAQCTADVGTPRLATALSVAAPIDPRTHTVRQLPDARSPGRCPTSPRHYRSAPPNR